MLGFPEFEQFCSAGFPAGTHLNKSVASTISPRPHAPVIETMHPLANPAKQHLLHR